jgi:hypothetical protein
VPVLIVIVVLVALLCLLDLVLTLGVIRRLKEHTTQLEQLLQGAVGADPLPPVGATVGEFVAAATNGVTVSQDMLKSVDALPVETLVAFFSPQCEPCREKLPGFLDHAGRWRNDQRRVVTVVTGPVEQATEMADLTTPVGITVLDGNDGPVSRAFRVTATPGFCLVDGTGRVTAADYDLDRMPALVQT